MDIDVATARRMVQAIHDLEMPLSEFFADNRNKSYPDCPAQRERRSCSALPRSY